MKNSAKTLFCLAEHFEDDIGKIATQNTISVFTNHLDGSNPRLCKLAAETLSCLFVSEDAKIVDYAINEQYFQRV